jgi:nucleotide-binding universal stress UspA family protein
MKTIVALIDFSDVTAKVLEQARQSAQDSSARVILLHVVPREPVVVDLGLVSPTILQPPSEHTIAADHQKLLSCRDSLTKAGIDAVVEQTIDGGVDRILEDSRRWDAELIIVGSHHHSPLYNLFVGTFTKDVSKRAHCPVLVVPADPEKA